jgi:hypothetical protein
VFLNEPTCILPNPSPENYMTQKNPAIYSRSLKSSPPEPGNRSEPGANPRRLSASTSFRRWITVAFLGDMK